MIVVRPLFFRTTFQLLASWTMMARVVPKRPVWSVPSAVMVSTLSPEKLRLYLLGPAASTFIWSVRRLWRGSSFHLPRNAATESPDAAWRVAVSKARVSRRKRVRLAMACSVYGLRCLSALLDMQESGQSGSGCGLELRRAHCCWGGR